MNKYAGLFLWSLVAVLALIVIAFKPDNSEVMDLKNQIVKLNSEIKYFRYRFRKRSIYARIQH